MDIETFDYSKIIWIVAIAGYFVLQMFVRNSSKAQDQQAQDDSDQQQSSFDELIEGRDFRRSRGEQSGLDSTPKSAPMVESSPLMEGSNPEPKKRKRVDFNLKKAVVMSEILNPKFKDQ